MGSYAYCHSCGAGMVKPTIREALGLEDWRCKRCYKERELVETNKDQVIVDALGELEERIEKLENHLWPENED